LQYLNIINHSDCKYIHYINEDINYDEMNIDSFEEKLNRNLQYLYNIPDEFEPNYKYYFSYYEYQERKKFEIYQDNTRLNLLRKFYSCDKGKINFLLWFIRKW